MQRRTLLLASLAPLAAPAIAQDYPSLRLRYASHVPENNVVSESDKFFASEVHRRSKGRVQVDMYWNRALARQQEMLPLISAGAVDLTTLETAQYGETPLMGFMNTIFPTFQDGRTLVEMSNWLYANSTGIRAELNRIGARVLFVRHLPHYHLLCRRPIRTAEEFRGARLRSFGAYVPVMWRSLGANAVNVVTTEMYDGLSKGTFDCTFLPAPFLANLRLGEVARYLVDVPFGMIEFAPTLVPNVVWNRWPASVRQLLTEVAAETEQFAIEKTDAESAEAVRELQRQGVEIVPFAGREEMLRNLPDLMTAWLGRQRAEGRGAAAEQIVTYARQRLNLPAR